DDRALLRESGAGFVAERNRPAAEFVEALERFDEMAEERVAALLAVGDDVEARCFLQRDRFVDGAVFDFLERGRCDLAALQLLARGREVRGTEQAADGFSAELRSGIHGRIVCPVRAGWSGDMIGAVRPLCVSLLLLYSV